MNFLDIDRFAATPLVTDPFPYLIVPGFLRATTLAEIAADFPRIEKAGSFPVSELKVGPVFEKLLYQLEGQSFRRAVAEKFAMDLSGLPTMITVRGRARAKDGQIHTDSKTKLITVLIYMNGRWEAPGGRLRLLRTPDSLNDVIAEVPPEEGTLLAFKVTGNSWHGHEPFVGERRVIQLNWVTGADVVQHEQRRHRLTARIKRLIPFA
jgi:hypothetical protein